ncbi:MAG: hypothetical protein K9M84_04135 [Spirochaetia bacterium]|nr:hypothetical protein [Spirochaetia bacterium]MCF7940778.1 hypothetical protein [Spirochaetia bacterium]
MNHKTTITRLSLIIAAAAAAAAAAGIFSHGGDGGMMIETVRGTQVMTHGYGIYRHMSSDVAIQGIAQDYVTLFAAVPALIAALSAARRGSLRAAVILTGVTAYLFVTYLLYLTMGMYHELFLLYVLLLCCSFFSLTLSLFSLHERLSGLSYLSVRTAKGSGIFLIVVAALMALLWLSAIIPPLLDGSIYPAGLQHYTTLIVQGMDLALFLPISAVCGLLLLRRTPMGVLTGPVLLVFLVFLMGALLAKIIAMGCAGDPIIPVVFIIPIFLSVSIWFSLRCITALPQVR